MPLHDYTIFCVWEDNKTVKFKKFQAQPLTFDNPAFTATTTVLALISTAPIAGLNKIPA